MTKQYIFFEDFDEFSRFRVKSHLGQLGLQSLRSTPISTQRFVPRFT